MTRKKTHTLLERFIRFIRDKKLIDHDHKILLTVSGGVDSVVMAHLFHEAGFDFGIAHCNFQLRGKESEGDADLVKTLANELSVPYHVALFDTQAYADTNALSIQMAARDLRYNWFREIAEKEHYSRIATAHHRDDLVETVLLNLVKGSVLKGLAGIPVQNGNIIRPMLFAGKNDIREFARENGISFREDSSNSSDKYQRNLIRNQVIPLLEKINPALSETIAEASEARAELANWLTDFVGQKLSAEQRAYGKAEVSIVSIRKNGLKAIHLYEWLSGYGFHFAEIKKLYQGLESTEALEFHSSTHRLLKERDKLVLMPFAGEKKDGQILVNQGQQECIFGERKLTFTELDKPGKIDFSDSSIAWLDAEKIQWPLILRVWQAGDYFYPAGFGKRKKISDYLTDIKLGKLEKEKQLVLLSGNGDIVWVVGKRVDDRVKVTSETKNSLSIRVTA